MVIKLFEEYTQNLSYRKINNIEFISFKRNTNQEQFTEKEIDGIINILPLKFTTIDFGNIIFSDSKDLILISKIEDEWYLVCIKYIDGKEVDKKFKCDQWDGLIDCLKNELY